MIPFAKCTKNEKEIHIFPFGDKIVILLPQCNYCKANLLNEVSFAVYLLCFVPNRDISLEATPLSF